MALDRVVHIIDDDAAMRDALAFLIEAHGLKAHVHASASDFLATEERPAAGCVVTDIRMPGMSGIELLKRMAEQENALPVIVITGHGDVPLAVEAMKSGAVDFLEKPFDDDKFLAAVDAALEKQRQAGEPGASDEAERAQIGERMNALTPRERDVLDGLVAGKPNKIIARDLGISPRTVEVYRANLMSKLQARALADLIRMALSVRG